MLVLNAVQFRGNDKRLRSSSRSLNMISRCSSATKSILWTKQKIFASGEFYKWKVQNIISQILKKFLTFQLFPMLKKFSNTKDPNWTVNLNQNQTRMAFIQAFVLINKPAILTL